MIILKTGNLFFEPTDVLINPVNCVGVMGAGLALQFKNRFPLNFVEYKNACISKLIQPGKVFIHSHSSGPPHYIVNFPTKLHWKNPSKIEYIEKGLEDLLIKIKQLNINSISIPPLGCGLGGLSWNTVKSLIENFANQIPNVIIFLFQPGRIK